MSLSVSALLQQLISTFYVQVIYLRQFHHLRSLNMAGNPCVYNSDEDFRHYICAFLPWLTYYEYRMITTEERAIAGKSYK
jgi:hypothetical protein